MKKYLVCLILALASLSTVSAQQSAANSNWQHKFQVTSTTFTNGGELPLSMVLGSANCSYISGGGDESPQVSWKHAPFGTRSFVVTLYDTTAAFTHWGMYNISPKTTELPENAGVSGSTDGQQVFNDFYLAPNTTVPVRQTTTPRTPTITFLPCSLSTLTSTCPQRRRISPPMARRSIGRCSTMCWDRRASTAISQPPTSRNFELPRPPRLRDLGGLGITARESFE